MKTKRISALILASLTLMTLFGASALAQNAAPQQNSTLGQVTKIDGNTITIALAEMPNQGGTQNGQAPSGNGEAPQGNPPSGDNAQAPSGNPPSGDNAQAPSGNPPSGDNAQAPKGGQGFNLTLTGETQAFTVSDATVITLRGGRDAQDTTGSLSDISVDSVVRVTLENGAATAITVESFAAPGATAAPAA